MFELMTFENIIKRMLDSVPDTFDKREGSIIYNALVPCCYRTYRNIHCYG
ncbi:hypothetical protein [Clostridioides difficile]